MRKSRWVYFWKAVLYVGIFLAMQIIAAIPVGIWYGMKISMEIVQGGGASLTPADLIQDMMDGILPFVLIISDVLALIVVTLLLKREKPKRSLAAALSLNGFSPWLILPLIFVGVFMNLAVEGVFSYLPESWLQSYGESSSLLDSMSPLMIVSTVVMAPLTEELVFRAAVMTRLRRGFSWAAAILIQAAFFAVCHGQLLWMTYTFALGALMGVIWMQTKSTWATILVHFGFNGLSALLMMENVSEFFEAIPAPVLVGVGFGMTACCVAAVLLQGGTDNIRTPYAWEDPEPYVQRAPFPSQNYSPYAQPYAAPNAAPYGQPYMPGYGVQTPYGQAPGSLPGQNFPPAGQEPPREG